MEKRLSLIRMSDRSLWVLSSYTGEIVRLFDLRGILRMVRDFYTPALY